MHTKLRLFSCLLIGMSCSTNLFAQSKGEYVEYHSDPSELVVYVSQKYGMDQTERIILNKQVYEFQHQVTVLCPNEYAALTVQLQQLADASTTVDEKNHWLLALSKLVLISTIEPIIQ